LKNGTSETTSLHDITVVAESGVFQHLNAFLTDVINFVTHAEVHLV
jgi:hypothetical protein